MENEKLAVTLTGEAVEKLNGSPLKIELHTTEENAPTLNEKVKFKKHVTLSSILDYLGKRSFPDKVKETTAVIAYCLNPESPIFEFYENPNDNLATVLTSKLLVNPDLLAFKVNSQEHFSQPELEALVRTKAHCFKNPNDAAELIKKLQNFEAKYEQEVKRSDDRQGKTEDVVKTAIKMTSGAISGVLSLSMPLYLGLTKTDFTVEIEIEKGRANLPTFGFYSMDLQISLIDTASEAISKAVLEVKEKFLTLEVEK